VLINDWPLMLLFFALIGPNECHILRYLNELAMNMQHVFKGRITPTAYFATSGPILSRLYSS